MDARALKEQHRRIRDGQSETLRVRIHRAISRLSRVEQEKDDLDARYIFLWIAFSQRVRLCAESARTGSAIHRTLAATQSGASATRRAVPPVQRADPHTDRQPFRVRAFWRAIREHDVSNTWETSFAAAKKLALDAVMSKDIVTLLSIMLDRLYVPRNQ